jgi:hypothetical protein
MSCRLGVYARWYVRRDEYFASANFGPIIHKDPVEGIAGGC